MTGDEVKPNIPLLRKIVEWVEEQEQLVDGREWDQAMWIGYTKIDDNWCQTTMCVAGKIAIETGWRPIRKDGRDEAFFVERDGITHSAITAAAIELGISLDDTHDLFSGGSTARNIRFYAEQIAGERL